MCMNTCRSHLTEEHKQEVLEQSAQEISVHRQWQIQNGLHELHFSSNTFWNSQIKKDKVGTTEDKISLWNPEQTKTVT